MSKVTPIKRNAIPAKQLGVAALDNALNGHRCVLYQVAGIMAIATEAIREMPTPQQIERAWAALDGAHALLMDTIENGLRGDTLLSAEVPHG